MAAQQARIAAHAGLHLKARAAAAGIGAGGKGGFVRGADANLCFTSSDSKRRSNIRIAADGNNYTAVQFVELDAGNPCE